MSIKFKKVIYCNECGYEYPNDNNFEKKDWIIAVKVSEFFIPFSKEERVHFCSEKCFKNYKEILFNGYNLIKDVDNYLRLYQEN